MSLDSFIGGPGHAMNWIFDFMAPDAFPEIAAATGAMLIGRRTYEVGGGWSGPVFVLTHRPPEPPDRRTCSSPVTSGKRSPRRW
jgi:dihydrofolate reductase